MSKLLSRPLHLRSTARSWLVLITLAALLSACGSRPANETAAPSALDTIRDRGSVVMLAWPHQESGFVRRMVKEYGEEGLNRFGGTDVEMMERFAEHLGVTLEIKPVEDGFNSLIPSLLNGEGDLIASSMTITDARREQVDFSRPYHAVDLVVLAAASSPISSVDDFPGLIASTVRGSSHEEHLRRLGFDDTRLHFVDFMLENYQAVAYGDADLTIVDSGSADTVLPQYAALQARVRRAFVLPVKDHYGVAVPQGHDVLQSALDVFLAAEEEAGRLPSL